MNYVDYAPHLRLNITKHNFSNLTYFHFPILQRHAFYLLFNIFLQNLQDYVVSNAAQTDRSDICTRICLTFFFYIKYSNFQMWYENCDLDEIYWIYHGPNDQPSNFYYKYVHHKIPILKIHAHLNHTHDLHMALNGWRWLNG